MKTLFCLYAFLIVPFCSFAQTNNNDFKSEVNLSDFGIDSLYNEQLKLKIKQGKLSDCEFGEKVANDNFNRQNYIYFSKELVGSCLYCDILQYDYDVKLQFFTNLFTNEYYSCYNMKMSQLLNKKYGFDIFEKTTKKVDSFYNAKLIAVQHEKNKGIPYLINNQKEEKIYIRDSCIEDTLKIRYRVEVIFEHSLIDTIMPMVVKSVSLIDMDIRSLNPPHTIASLSKSTLIKSPLQQYIWDLCSAKFAYWYKFQSYSELSSGERIKRGNTIYMGSTIWLVPEL
jgi:hypothetical protein